MRYKAQGFPKGGALYLIAEKKVRGGDVDIFNIYIQKRKGTDQNSCLPFLFLFNVDIFNIYIKQKRKVCRPLNYLFSKPPFQNYVWLQKTIQKILFPPLPKPPGGIS
jgi:hypothetical protein